MRVEWSSPALADLREIDSWLTREASAAQAVGTLSAIRERAGFMVGFPRGGRPHPDGTRLLRVFGTPYLSRYQISGDVVSVLRQHHEREDWFVLP